MTERWMVVQPEQANVVRGCANCGAAIGEIHGVACYEAAKARQHIAEHLTDGHWHDNCTYCQHRRRHGGDGLSADLAATPSAPIEGDRHG